MPSISTLFVTLELPRPRCTTPIPREARPSAGAPAHGLVEVAALAGRGLDGDRHVTGAGDEVHVPRVGGCGMHADEHLVVLSERTWGQ